MAPYVPPATNPAPTLSIALSGNNVVLTWPASGSNYWLESSPNLKSNSWVNVTNPPSFSVSVPTASGNEFFSLKAPAGATNAGTFSIGSAAAPSASSGNLPALTCARDFSKKTETVSWPLNLVPTLSNTEEH
jgi:hypothetical protein